MTTCTRCAATIADGSAFCPACGTTVGAPLAGTPMPQMFPPPAVYVMASRTSGMAIAGFVLSFFCGLLGLIFSIIGYNECRASNRMLGPDGMQIQQVNGEGLALAGIIISCLGMVLGLMLALSRH
jgi:hypothetical protein